MSVYLAPLPALRLRSRRNHAVPLAGEPEESRDTLHDTRNTIDGPVPTRFITVTRRGLERDCDREEQKNS